MSEPTKRWISRDALTDLGVYEVEGVQARAGGEPVFSIGQKVFKSGHFHILKEQAQEAANKMRIARMEVILKAVGVLEMQKDSYREEYRTLEQLNFYK